MSNNNKPRKKWYEEDDLFDWEDHEQKVYDRFSRKMKQVGMFIIITTLIGSILGLVAIFERLFYDN